MRFGNGTGEGTLDTDYQKNKFSSLPVVVDRKEKKYYAGSEITPHVD
jgi:hypothetical protein